MRGGVHYISHTVIIFLLRVTVDNGGRPRNMSMFNFFLAVSTVKASANALKQRKMGTKPTPCLKKYVPF